MGSLSSLYISQSYQSLTHLGTNNALSAGTMTQLQDGIGQSLNISFDGTNISSSGNIFAANLTGSQVNTSSLVTTSSFNSYTSSTNARLNSIETTTASLNSSVSALNTNSASVNISISNLNSTTASQAISITNLNSFSQSAQASINSLNAATSSYANSASVALVDANQQSQINSLIAATGSYLTASADITALNAFTASQYVSNSFFATTGSNTFIGNQTITGNLLVSGSDVIDVNVIGRVSITAPNTGITPRLFISSSDATSEYGRGFQNLDTTNSTALNAFQYLSSNVAKQSDSFVAVYNSDFSVDVEMNMFANSSSIGLADWDNGATFTYVPFMTIAPNLGNNPAPVMTRGLQVTGSTQIQNFTASLQTGYAWVGGTGNISKLVATSSFGTSINTGSFATTGSNNFIGNQTISGSLTISGSGQNDLSVIGQVFVSSTATGATTEPKITVSGSGGQSVIGRASIQTENATNAAALNPAATFAYNKTTFDEIGLSLDTIAFTNWTNGPAIYTNDPTDSYPAKFGFQDKANYTDGRVTVLTPLVAQSGSIITGSLDVLNTFTASLTSGYVWVGGSNNRTVLVATSSFGGGGSTIDTGSFATTGSNSFVATQTITGSVNITGQYLINGVAISGSNISQFATTGSNTFNGNQNINGILTLSSSANSYFQFTSPNNATGSGAIFFGGLGPYIQTYGDESKQGLQLVAGLSGSFALVTRYAGNVGEIDLHAQYDNSTPGTTYSRIRAFSNGQISMAAEGGAITISGSSTNIQGVNFIPFSASLNTRILAITGSGGTINTGSFATTGSNSFIGNQTITGNLLVSGSNPIDVNVVGRVSITGPTSGETPKLFISSSDGAYTELNRNFNQINTTNVNGGLDAYGQIYASTSSVAGMYVGVYDDPNFNTDVELNIVVTKDSGSLCDWDNSNYISVPFLTVVPNTGNNPIPIMTRGLTIQSGSSFFANGNKQFNVGAFSSLVTQSGSANVSQSMNFATTDISDGVSIASNSRITLANSGTYNIQFSAQVLAATGADTVWIWLKKNGTNVADTSTKLVLRNNEADVAAWNFVVDGAAADYFELAWQSSGGHAKLFAEAAAGNYPAIPSIILTVTQVR